MDAPANCHCPTRVAIVDDDLRLRRELGLTLRHYGYEPLLFESAEEFLASPPTASIGCMLLDVRMPGVSGIDLLSKLPRENRSYPIIMLTSEMELEVEEEALLRGANAFLLKGRSDLVTLAAIEQAIGPARA
jgi:FixJ family two-component response regulator